MYSCVLWCQFIDLVGVFSFYCLTPVTLFIIRSTSYTGGPSSPQERGRDSCLRAVLCYTRLFTKACMACKRFFLKERKNVMFLNKIDVPYCLVVFFVVLPASQAVLKRFW